MLKKSLAVMMLVVLLGVNAFAMNDSQREGIRGVFIRDCIAFEPNYTTMCYTYRYVGCAYGDNRNGSNPLTINYTYESSGSATASIEGYSNVSVEANCVYASMEYEMGFGVTESRTWTVGNSSGAVYQVQPGNFEAMFVYIPAVKTEGRLTYRVYMDGYPENYHYEYRELDASYAPLEASVYFRIDRMR